jgi:type II secretory pathway pseudopilin PulG
MLSRTYGWIRSTLSSEGGFTLAELLVTVGIVVGLAAVILPNVGRFTGEGQRGALATELASVQTAIDAWAIDNTITPLPLPLDWANELLTGTGNSNGLNLNGYLRLPGGATLTDDSYCWNAQGTVRQQSTDGGLCP